MITKYNTYINESIRDKMTPVSNEEAYEKMIYLLDTNSSVCVYELVKVGGLDKEREDFYFGLCDKINSSPHDVYLIDDENYQVINDMFGLIKSFIEDDMELTQHVLFNDNIKYIAYPEMKYVIGINRHENKLIDLLIDIPTFKERIKSKFQIKESLRDKMTPKSDHEIDKKLESNYNSLIKLMKNFNPEIDIKDIQSFFDFNYDDILELFLDGWSDFDVYDEYQHKLLNFLEDQGYENEDMDDVNPFF